MFLDKNTFSTFSDIQWAEYDSGNKTGILHNGVFYLNGDVLHPSFIETTSDIVTEPLFPKMNTKYIGMETKKTGGLGAHLRTQLQSSNGSLQLNVLALGLSSNTEKQKLEEFVMLPDSGCAFKTPNAYPYYNFQDDVVADLILFKPNALTQLIVRLAFRNISAICLDTESHINFVCDRFTRTYEMFNAHGDHALNKPSRDPSKWRPVFYCDIQHYTAESLGRTIAKTKTIPNVLMARIPSPLKEAITNQTEMANYENGMIMGPVLKPKHIKGDIAPKLCKEYQELIITAFLYERFLTQHDNLNVKKIRALLLFFGLLGYCPHQLGSYTMSGKHRGTGKNVRTLSGEKRGMENIAEESLKRVRIVNGKWVGQKY